MSVSKTEVGNQMSSSLTMLALEIEKTSLTSIMRQKDTWRFKAQTHTFFSKLI